MSLKERRIVAQLLPDAMVRKEERFLGGVQIACANLVGKAQDELRVNLSFIAPLRNQFTARVFLLKHKPFSTFFQLNLLKKRH